MIKKALLFFIVFLAGWLTLTQSIQWPSKSISQWENNDRLVGNYLYSNEQNNWNTLIVGSSMAYRMSINQNPYKDSVYNLALGGLSIYEGLEIIKQSNHIPKYLLIESNVLHRFERENFASSYFIPGITRIKSTFIGMQPQYKPITFIQYIYFGVRSRLIAIFKTPKDHSESITPSFQEDKTNVNLKKHNLDKIILNHNRVLENWNWEKAAEKINHYIQYFEKQGSKVILFEMPCDSLLLGSNYYRFVRHKINYTWPQVSHLKASGCKTTDGVHLSPDVAQQFLPILLNQVHE